MYFSTANGMANAEGQAMTGFRKVEMVEVGPRDGLQNEAAVVATVFCDNSLRYLSTDLARAEPARPGSIVGDVRFDHVSMIRAC